MADEQSKLAFRENASINAEGDRDIGPTLALVAPKDHIVIGIVTFLILGFAAWTLWGRIPVEIEGRGVVMHRGGFEEIESEVAGRVTEYNVREGDWLKPGQRVARITTVDGRVVDHFCRSSGKVTEELVSVRQVVRDGTPLLRIVDEKAELVAVVYVDAQQSARLTKGMRVFLSARSTANMRLHPISGEVASISKYPRSSMNGRKFLVAKEQVALLSSESPQIEVLVNLRHDEVSRITTGTSSGVDLKLGVLCNARITIQEVSPLVLVFPGIDEILN